MRQRRRGLTLLELLLICAVVQVLVALWLPNYIRPRARGQVTACKSNLKNIATALEMYSTDYGGRFPLEIPGPLTPNYLRTLPTCPATRSVTYISGYWSQSNPDAYNIACDTANHRGVDITTTGYPQYNSATGLIERP